MASPYAGKSTVAAMGTVIDESGSVLMLQRQKDPYIGLWAMPGGKVEVGEHPDATMVREFQEETGLAVAVQRFGGSVSEVFCSASGEVSHFLLYVFRLKIDGGALTESHEGPLRWVRKEELADVVIPSDLWMIQNLLLADRPPALTLLRTTERTIVVEGQHG